MITELILDLYQKLILSTNSSSQFIFYSDGTSKKSTIASNVPMKEDILNSPSRVPHVGNSESENALATFFDVAVLRCLFISHWPEDGVYWALIFFHKRYEDYSYFNDKYHIK